MKSSFLTRKNLLSAITVFVLALVLLLYAVYPCLHADLAVMDDPFFVAAIPQTGSVAQDLWQIVKTDKSIFLPVTGMSYRLDTVFAQGVNGHFPAVARLSNIFFLALAGALLFLIWSARSTSLWLPALAAVLMCVHPLHFSSIAWIFTRKDILVFLAMLTVVYAYSKQHYKTALLFFVVALLAKLSAYGLVLWICVYEALRMTHLTKRDAWGKALTHVLPFVICAAVLVPVMTKLSSHVSKVDWVFEQAPRLLMFYAAKTVWPWPIVKIYPTLPPMTLSAVLMIGAVSLIVFTALVGAARRYKNHSEITWITEDLALALAFILPYVIVVPIHLLICDAYALSFVGAIVGIVLSLALFATRISKFKFPAVFLVVVLIIGSTAYNRAMARDYVDPLGVYEKNTRVYPQDFLAQMRLGHAAQAMGRYPIAVQAYETAMRLTFTYFTRINADLFGDWVRAGIAANDAGAVSRAAALASRNSTPFYCLEVARMMQGTALASQVDLSGCQKRYPTN